MDAYNSEKATPANITKDFTAKQIRVSNMKNEGDGFCICPKCFHLVFDELLTGICPCCNCQFCPPCSLKKSAS